MAWYEELPDSKIPDAVHGDHDKEAIYAAIGHASQAWEALENSLAMTFTLLVQAPTFAGMKAYGANSSTGGRLDMLSEVAKAYCYTNERAELLSPINSIINRIRRASGLRARIVHGIIAAKIANNRLEVQMCGTDRVYEEAEYFLISATYNSRATKLLMQPKYAWDSGTIRHLAKHFGVLSSDVCHLNLRQIQRNTEIDPSALFINLNRT